MSEEKEPQNYFEKLIALMDRLRGPGGCPWDREQTRETLKPMLIEEAYEVLEALDGEDPDELCEELGDLLFQIIFHSRIAKERGEFDAHEVCRRVYEKMVRRHPHVFGEAKFDTSEELLRNWEDLKRKEKQAEGKPVDPERSLLDGIPAGLPQVYRAYQMGAKASRVGFDWPDLDGLREKLLEEFEELQRAHAAGDEERVREEVGDLLFAAVNVARFLGVDPETALARANRKFEARFRALETVFRERGEDLKDASSARMEEVWELVKGKQG
ncbi:MAG: nucleoside triphosphate pyrophosphohydrolase [Acidobacteriota bacterium]